MRHAVKSAPLGAYDMRGARYPTANNLPTSRRNLAVETIAVANPLDTRTRIAVSRRVNHDILTVERAVRAGDPNERRGISEAAYQAGEQLRTLLQSAGVLHGQSFAGCDRVDQGKARDAKIVRMIDAADAIKARMAQVTKVVGPIDARIIRQVLGDGLLYSEVAQKRDALCDARHAGTYIGQRFRDALELLAEDGAATGAERSRTRYPDAGE